jgi:hypothetical protein
MLKCPFCGFDNEDGALFCEQCKSDLSAVPATPAAAAPAAVEAIPMAAVEAVPVAAVEAIPMAAVEAMPAAVAAVVAEPAPAAPAPAAPAAPEAAPAAPAAGAIPPGSQVKLVVIRGLKINAEFPIYPELNFIGRADEKPVDIDLEDQEPPERIWCSRQHAVINYDEPGGTLTLEDLNSANGTFVNRARVFPGNKQPLKPGDTIQIGTVHMKVKV